MQKACFKNKKQMNDKYNNQNIKQKIKEGKR